MTVLILNDWVQVNVINFLFISEWFISVKDAINKKLSHHINTIKSINWTINFSFQSNWQLFTSIIIDPDRSLLQLIYIPDLVGIGRTEIPYRAVINGDTQRNAILVFRESS